MFANPLLLIFLPLVLVPILLHLLTLYKLRTVELSTFRFLMDSYFKQRRRLKLMEWLLMALRVLFVLLIILAMSRPVLDQFGWLFASDGEREVVLVIDAGAAMNYKSGGTTSLERAKQAATAVISKLGKDDLVEVIRAGRNPKLLVSAFASKTQLLGRHIEQITTDPTHARLPAALKLVASSDHRGKRMVYLLSDMQRVSWEQLRQHPTMSDLEKTTQWVVLDLGNQEPVENVGVLGEPPKSLRPVVGLPIVLNASAKNFSADKPADVTLSVVVNDQQVGARQLLLAPGERFTTPVVINPTRPGVMRGSFRVAGDAFSDDDVYHFCINVAERLKVLLIAGRQAAKTIDRPEVFVQTALKAPLLVNDQALATERQLAESLQIRTIRQDQFMAQHLTDVDVVVLADVNMNQVRGEQLRAYINNGGGLVVFPGPSTTPDLYRQHLLPKTVELGVPLGDPNDVSTFLPVTGVDLSHPILSVFETDEDELDPFATTRIYRRFPIQSVRAPTNPTGKPEPDIKGTRTRNLIRLPDGNALLSETTIGRGRMLLFAVPATPNWSNLPLKPEFVPLILRAIAHVRRPTLVEMDNAVQPFEPARIRMSDRWRRSQILIKAPDSRSHTVDVHRSGQALEGAFVETQRTGQYTCRINPNVADAPSRIEMGFTVNLDPNHADFSTLAEPAVRSLFAPQDIVYLRGNAQDPTLFDRLSEKHEIWRSLIWLTFAVIVVEFLLSTLGGGRRKKRESDFPGLGQTTGSGPSAATGARANQLSGTKQDDDRRMKIAG